MDKPEEQARQEIDRKLAAAEWVLQTYRELNLGAAPGIAVTEYRGKLVPQDPSDPPAEKLLERIRAEREAQAAKEKAAGKAKRKKPPRKRTSKRAPRKRPKRRPKGRR